MQVSFSALNLLKHTLSYTGDKEVSDKGDEIMALRRLSGEESSQRRHLNKVIEPISKEFLEKVKEFQDIHNAKVEEMRKQLKEAGPKTEGEEDKAFEVRINAVLNTNVDLIASLKEVNEKVEELLWKKHEIELPAKVLGVVKKYFKEYSEKNGFVEADDRGVEEVEEILK